MGRISTSSDYGTTPDRVIGARPVGDGSFKSSWKLTPESITDPVVIVLNPNVLPIVFVPGIMGSNLKSKGANSQPVWRLDAGFARQPTSLIGRWRTASAGDRQATLHPSRCQVDDDGHAPDEPVGTVANVSIYKQRGWGEVAQTSYHEFLLSLEKQLNTFRKLSVDQLLRAAGHGNAQTLQDWRAEKPAQAISEQDAKALNGWHYPVYAYGYNWLDSNKVAADGLMKRINQIIKENNKGLYRCEQVVVITHSMGGLVARRCQMLEGMEAKIAGIVHGVMPAIGAPVAYRRIKVGMRDEDALAGMVLGQAGTDVTPVFAQSPGALQLLPNKQYPQGWLRVTDDKGRPLAAYPKTDPYAEIYRNHKDWWGLIKEEWLAPKGGKKWTWDDFIDTVKLAEDFHEVLGKSYHPNTYVYCGEPTSSAEKNSMARMTWQAELPPTLLPPKMSTENIANAGLAAIDQSGANPLAARYPDRAGIAWSLVASGFDAGGDGTVPAVSGRAPIQQNPACVQQQVRLSGFKHEGSYRDSGAQDFVFYALARIAAQARLPAAGFR